MPDVTWKILSDLLKEGDAELIKRGVENDQMKKANEHHKKQRNDNKSIDAIMSLIRPAIDASLAEGTKKHKRSLLRYWDMYCAAFNIDMKRFGKNQNGSDEEKR